MFTACVEFGAILLQAVAGKENARKIKVRADGRSSEQLLCAKDKAYWKAKGRPPCGCWPGSLYEHLDNIDRQNKENIHGLRERQQAENLAPRFRRSGVQRGDRCMGIAMPEPKAYHF